MKNSEIDFRNGVEWYGKVPENLELLNFRKANYSTENSRMKIKRNGNFQEKGFENLGIPREVVLFLEIM